MKELTAKQRMFVAEYAADSNVMEAAIRAGYSFSTTKDGYYVYFLADPRNGNIFYVGKGKGTRVHSHAKNAKAGKIDNAPKVKRIREIINDGHEVAEIIFASSLSERKAYAIERLLIERFQPFGLTNIVGGIVSNEEATRMKASDMLARLKPYDQWVADLDPVRMAQVLKLTSTPRDLYDQVESNIRQLAAA